MMAKGSESLARRELVRDPICGMELDPSVACRTEIGERTYYFCRPSCKASFKRAYYEKTKSPAPKNRKASGGGGGSCH